MTQPEKKNKTLVLGLSHIYGETRNIDQQVAFWQRNGFALDFKMKLPVPSQKQQALLNNHNAREVNLHYLKFTGIESAPGIEFLNHLPADSQTLQDFPSGLTLVIRGNQLKQITDYENNRVIIYPHLFAPALSMISTPDVKASSDLLEVLGFQRKKLELAFWEDMPKNVPRTEFYWELNLPLFPRLAVPLILIEDRARPVFPKVDDVGFVGLSLVTRSFEEIEKHFPISCYQKFVSPKGNAMEIAFLNDSGLLIEFLKIGPKT